MPNFLRKVDTDLTFPWNPKLAKRADMIPVSAKKAAELRDKKHAADKKRVADATLMFTYEDDVEEVLTLGEQVDAMDEAALRAKAAEMKISVGPNWGEKALKKHVLEAMTLAAEDEDDDASFVPAGPTPQERVLALDEDGLAGMAEELKVSIEDMSVDEQRQTVLNALIMSESDDMD